MKSLVYSARDGNIAEVKNLLAQPEIDVNAANKDGYTPLHWAALFGYTEIAKALLQKDSIDVNTANIYGNTALHLAATNGYTEIALALLEKGANVTVVTKDGHTPLHLATTNGRTETTKALLEKGATANAQTVIKINERFKDKGNAPKMVPVPGKDDLFCSEDYLLARQAQMAAAFTLLCIFSKRLKTITKRNGDGTTSLTPGIQSDTARMTVLMVKNIPIGEFTKRITEENNKKSSGCTIL